MQIKMFCLSTERWVVVYILAGQPEAMYQIQRTICYNTKSSHYTMSIDDTEVGRCCKGKKILVCVVNKLLVTWS